MCPRMPGESMATAEAHVLRYESCMGLKRCRHFVYSVLWDVFWLQVVDLS